MTPRILKKSLLFIIAIILVLGLSISFQSLLAAWTAPAANPPTCATGNAGCDAPLNAGPLIQLKSGALWLNTNGLSPYGLIVENGNVGIGTASPSEKLTVAGGHGDTKLRLYSTGDGGSQPANLSLWASEPGWTYTGTGIGYNVKGSPYYGRIDNARGSSYVRFLPGETKFEFQNTSNTYISNVLVLKENGNVGIGTTGPGQKLHVIGNIQASGDIYLGTRGAWLSSWLNQAVLTTSGPTFSTVYTSNWFRSTGNTGWYSQTYGGGWYMTDSTWIRSYGNKNIYHSTGIMRTDGTLQVGSGGGTLNVASGGNFAYRTNVLFANTAGNVGIGTTGPGYKLEVVGGPIKATGGLIIETRTSDPASPVTGQIWLRTDF